MIIEPNRPVPLNAQDRGSPDAGPRNARRGQAQVLRRAWRAAEESTPRARPRRARAGASSYRGGKPQRRSRREIQRIMEDASQRADRSTSRSTTRLPGDLLLFQSQGARVPVARGGALRPRPTADLPTEREQDARDLRRSRGALRGRPTPRTRCALRRSRGQRRALSPRGHASDRQGDRRAAVHDGAREAALRDGDVCARCEHAGAKRLLPRPHEVQRSLLRTGSCSHASTGRWRAALDGRASTSAGGCTRSLDETELTYREHRVPAQRTRTEPVKSRFNLSYSAILNLYRRIGDRVPEAWQTARFARYQRQQAPEEEAVRGQAAPAAGAPATGATRPAGVRLIDARLSGARGPEHYIVDGQLTRKGRALRQDQWLRGCRDRGLRGVGGCSGAIPSQAAMLFASIVYEARPS